MDFRHQLIKLGSEEPDLRPHIRSILDRMKAGFAQDQIKKMKDAFDEFLSRNPVLSRGNDIDFETSEQGSSESVEMISENRGGVGFDEASFEVEATPKRENRTIYEVKGYVSAEGGDRARKEFVHHGEGVPTPEIVENLQDVYSSIMSGQE